MNLDLSRVLVDEHLLRLRDAAQAPPGALAMLVLRLVRRQAQPAVPTAWVARSSEMRAPERLAA